MAVPIYIGDTAIVEASIFSDNNGFTPDNPTDATWELTDPHGNPLIVSSLPTTTIAGDIIILNQANGGFDAWDEVQYNGSTWTRIGAAVNDLEGYTASLTVPGDVTDIPGIYKALVHFTLDGPIRKSQLVTFEALDALGVGDGSPEAIAKNRAWQKLEDCFDSALGGPWLRDSTLSFFNQAKMEALTPDAIYRINYTFYPVTSFTETTFDYTNDGPLFSQSLLVETIYHLMRSYVEQPNPDGNPVVWLNRRDYVSRWKVILDQEEAKFNKWIDPWKAQFFGFGAGAMLIGGYASTALRAPRALRTRLPRYYAGMYRRW